MSLPWPVFSWNSSTNLYSPALSARTVSVALPPGGMTFSCLSSLLSNSIAVLPALVTSSCKRLPAGTSITAGVKTPSFATSLKRVASSASTGTASCSAKAAAMMLGSESSGFLRTVESKYLAPSRLGATPLAAPERSIAKGFGVVNNNDYHFDPDQDQPVPQSNQDRRHYGDGAETVAPGSEQRPAVGPEQRPAVGPEQRPAVGPERETCSQDRAIGSKRETCSIPGLTRRRPASAARAAARRGGRGRAPAR